jgi:hypothetical protein
MAAKAALTRSGRVPLPPAWLHTLLTVTRFMQMRAGGALGLFRTYAYFVRTRANQVLAAVLASAAASHAHRILCSINDTSMPVAETICSWRPPRAACIGLRIAGCLLATAIAVLAIFNNRYAEIGGTGAIGGDNGASVRNETIVVRQERLPNSYVDNEGDVAVDESEEEVSYPRTVQILRFPNPKLTLASRAGMVLASVGGFVGFPGKQAIKPLEMPEKINSARGGAIMAKVDLYLWEVYQRSPTKKDHSGDFTWKDPAAAKQMGIPIWDYVIGGMDPEFREQLYHAGRAMDAEGIQWSILSGFRDDYRQGLASGYKARVGNSLHGGSKRTGGYGYGRAVDVTNADGDAEVVWRWLDKHGAKYGLHRPMPGNDPAHVQSRGEWRELALSLRESRRRAAEAANDKADAADKSKVAASK